MAKFYYAVRRGRIPGIYESWEECRNEVSGFPNALYKKFPDRAGAEAFLEDRGVESGEAPAAAKIETECIAFVDGSFNSDERVYGSGVVLIYQDGTYETFTESGSDPELFSMRNVAGEIHAAIRAVKEAEARNFHSLTIFYDYAGIEFWADGSWKANKTGTRQYRSFMEDAQNRMEIRFKKVRAHTGVRFNEMADCLAKEAAGILDEKKA